MVPTNSRKSIWRKSWDDYTHSLHSGKVWTGELIALAISGALAIILVPPAWSEELQAWFAAAVVISTGFAIALLLYLLSFVSAPFRLLKERDNTVYELRAQVDKDSDPRLAVPNLHILDPKFDGVEYDSNGRKLGRFSAGFSTDVITTVERVSLRVSETTLDAIDWPSEYVNMGVWFGFGFKTELPEWMGYGPHTGEILAYTKEGSWRSAAFEFTL